MFRAMAQLQREQGRELASHQRAVRDLALAAVEALELLSDATEPYKEDLHPVREAAIERLQRAGIRFDGAVGEPVDLARHRVVKSRRRAGVTAPVVSAVIRAGVTVGPVRVREAEVVIDEPENS
jgi:molecular chaperone GrpE (heat shock protein)